MMRKIGLNFYFLNILIRKMIIFYFWHELSMFKKLDWPISIQPTIGKIRSPSKIKQKEVEIKLTIFFREDTIFGCKDCKTDNKY